MDTNFGKMYEMVEHFVEMYVKNNPISFLGIPLVGALQQFLAIPSMACFRVC